MSRKIVFQDERLTIVIDNDQILGRFLQIYDNKFINETSEGEGIVFDWSERFGIERNLTGLHTTDNAIEIVNNYIVIVLNEEILNFDPPEKI